MAPRGSAMTVVLMLAVALSGCMEFEFGPAVPESALEVLGSNRESGGCTAPPSEEWCHEVTARLSNLDNESDLEVNRMDWSAVGSDGGVYSARSDTGPDAVAPERESTFTITFETPPNVWLETLRFKSFRMDEPVKAPIRDTD